MAANSEVLREYLLSLGFRVNSTETRKFTGVLDGINKRALLTGGALVGVAAGVARMVNTFAAGMEKMFYASQRARSTVGNLQAIEYGGKAIGLSAGQASGAILNMARGLRSNPGLIGLLKSFGVRVEGRDMSDVTKDMVRYLKQLPYATAIRYASLFGMDEDTYFMMSQNLDKLDQFSEKRKQMAAEAGVDADAAAAAAVEYRNLLSQTTERAGLLKDALAIALLPTMQKAVVFADQFLLKITQAVMAGDYKGALGQALTGGNADKPFPKFDWSKAGQGTLSGLQAIREWIVGGGDRAAGRNRIYGAGLGPNMPGANPGIGASQGVTDVASVDTTSKKYSDALFAKLEKAYGLPRGMLDSMYAAESGRGKYMMSPKGARGPFQFMPKTAAEYGISGMEDDLDASAEAAARKMAGLRARYGNDRDALAAYNYGEGNYAKVGNNLGATPAETQAYVPKVMGGIQQTNTFIVYGQNAEATATSIENKLNAVNGKLVTDMGSAVQ